MGPVVLSGFFTVCGAGLFAWTVLEGRTTVGKGLNRRTITRAQQPVAFTVELIKLGVMVGLLGLVTVWMWVKGH